MKKLFSLLLALTLLPMCFASAEPTPIPDAFTVTYTTQSQLIKNKQAYVTKEYVATAQPSVDEAIRAIVDAYDAEISSTLTPRPTPKRNSRLDINVIHSVCGQSLVSFKVLARTVLNRKQLSSPFVCHTYDMTDGHEIFLTDFFAADSPAWDIIAKRVRDDLSMYFPGTEADAAALDALCATEALQQAPFTLSPFSLSLHYYADTLYPGKTTLMRATIPLYLLDGMMTDYGAQNTDSSMYQYVALTYDDGPSYANSAAVITALRQGGAKATFFLLGNLVGEYPDIAMRENDEDHSVQSHHWNHVNAEDYSAERLRTNAQRAVEAISAITGRPPVMMRPPYGKYAPFAAAGVPMPLINWEVDTKDWVEGRKPNGMLRNISENVTDGAIILMHDIHAVTAEAAPLVISWLREQNYLCVTVEELYWRYGQELQPGVKYNRSLPVAE